MWICNFLGSFENLDSFSIGVDISAKQINYANRKYGNSAKFIELINLILIVIKTNLTYHLSWINRLLTKEVNELIEVLFF